jgi:hypothetical protein
MPHSLLNNPTAIGRLSFALNVDQTRPWWRGLELDGKPLYRIGNICDTCEAIFGRFDTAQLPHTPAELSQLLRTGIDHVSPFVSDTVVPLLPRGQYAVALLPIQPALLQLHTKQTSQADFYLWENSQPALVPEKVWPAIPRLQPWWFAQSDPVEHPGLKDRGLYEAVLPLVNEEQLDQTTIDFYKRRIQEGHRPTALALSVVDVRAPSACAFDWRLIHFLLDGHHKLMAASQLGQSITLLSFLNIDESFARPEWITHTIKYRYGDLS